MAQLELWQAAVLGLVEGITEYLPISSTGHLILASSLMGLDRPEVKEAVDDFNVVIQGGAILAVLGLYWPRVLRMLRGLAGKDPEGFALARNILLAFLPAAVIGLLLHKHIKAMLFNPGAVLAAILLGGIFMMLIDQWRSGRFGPRPMASREADVMDITPRQALIIGFLQCIAMWPGTSRSMMTIGGGIIAGLRPRAAAEFSFLLGVPTLGAACLLDLGKNLYRSHRDGTPNLFMQLGPAAASLGLIVATASAAVAVKWLVGFLNRHGLTPFGWYRIALFAVMASLMAAGVVRMG